MEILHVMSTNFFGVIIGSNVSWEVHVERTCNRITCNLFVINRLSKMLDLFPSVIWNICVGTD
jgi:hypothetical protein